MNRTKFKSKLTNKVNYRDNNYSKLLDSKYYVPCLDVIAYFKKTELNKNALCKCHSMFMAMVPSD